MRRTWVAFSDLKPGDHFSFVYDPTGPEPKVSSAVYRKRNRNWFEDADGKIFRTGVMTAVLHRVDVSARTGTVLNS